MDIIKAVLAALLGAGKGFIGTAIRVGVAGVSGWLIAKGVDIDAGTVTSLTETLTGVSLAILAAVGSALNGNKPGTGATK